VATGWDDLATATVADNVAAARVLDPAVHHLAGPPRAVGPAFTVRTGPGGYSAVREALGAAPAGCVLVIAGSAGNGERGRAIWGEVSTAIAIGRGVQGVVVDGAVRDLAALRDARFPVFGLGTTPRGPDREVAGDVGVTVVCAGVEIRPGDLVLADADGVVAVPERALETGLSVALAGERRERERLAEVRNAAAAARPS
jgi:4-hydroxy-4-methyl-2-oxoglutarate aldolase